MNPRIFWWWPLLLGQCAQLNEEGPARIVQLVLPRDLPVASQRWEKLKARGAYLTLTWPQGREVRNLEGEVSVPFFEGELTAEVLLPDSSDALLSGSKQVGGDKTVKLYLRWKRKLF